MPLVPTRSTQCCRIRNVDATGSISGASRAGNTAAEPSEVDLAYARATAADVLSRSATGNSVPWQNPHTGVGGNITPLARSHIEDGSLCRDFLASYLRASSQAWLQGSACRTSRGAWEVRSLKPLNSG